MAIATGTATNYRDLLDRLRLFLTTNPDLVSAQQQWIAQKWINGATTQELILRAPGTSGDDEIFVGFYSFQDASFDYYNWAVAGFTGFSFTSAFMAQPGANTSYGPDPQDLPALNLANSSIDYTFIANGRRVIVCAKIGSRYYQAYAGLALPFATPLDLAYPFAIMANRGGGRTKHSDVTSCRDFDAMRAGEWHQALAYPVGQPAITPNYDSGLIMLPVYLYEDLGTLGARTGRFFGELEGVSFIPGSGVNSGDKIFVNPVYHSLFQDAGLTGPGDFLAFKET